MAYPVMPLGFLGNQGDSDTYRIERSLRFNSADSAYLNRTFGSPTNNKIFTYSCWVKSNGSSARQPIFIAINAGATSIFGIELAATTQTLLLWDSNYSFSVPALTTSQVFRDVSAWYHIVMSVDTTQATAANRTKLYVNGSQISSFSSENYAAQNSSPYMNSAVSHSIGSWLPGVAAYASLYMTELNFIDGQALTPSSFGETDAVTGRWKAKAYSGTYGTNGFYLKFADNSGTTSTTLGKDSSGNGNNWTPNNFSVTAGAGNDSLVDSPSNYGTDTGAGGEVRGNYCNLNPLDKSSNITLANGNLDYSQGATTGICRSTIGISSGKWYWEILVTATNPIIGIAKDTASLSGSYVGADANGWGYYGNDGAKYTNGSSSSYGSTYTTNDIIGVAFNADTGSLVFYKNNVSQGTAFTGLTSGPYFPAISRGNGSPSASFNFGQRPFAYTAPSGFKALCTQNLNQPTIQKPSSAMDVVTYTGTGASQSISSLGFSPDLVWIKGRSGATDHALYDTTRGVQRDLGSNLTTDETTQAQGLTAFGTNGFTIGTLAKLNTNTSTYVAWCWDESAMDGVDIVSYTGNGTNRTISHNLGVAPKMIIVKARTTAGADQGWPVYHASFANTEYLLLNSTAAKATGTDYWNSTSPTASVFSLGTNAAVNTNNDTYVAYAFSEVDGFSKFGSYTGNGSEDGPFVWCGFRPRWVMIKRTDTNLRPWCIHDAGRDISNVSNSELEANSSTVENGGTYPGDLDILSNGLKLREGNSAWINENGGTYIFAAFAESPFKYARAR